MRLIGLIHLKTTSLYQQRALMSWSRQVTSGQWHLKQNINKLYTISVTSATAPIFTCCCSCIIGAWVVLDSSTPLLNKLTIIGVLEIAEMKNNTSSRQTRAAPEINPLVINAIYISIQVSWCGRKTLNVELSRSSLNSVAVSLYHCQDVQEVQSINRTNHIDFFEYFLPGLPGVLGPVSESGCSKNSWVNLLWFKGNSWFSVS